ncbi:MAG: hypothetical protein ACE5EO_02235 [Candidatus Krumholzibacteriia bacterium]
MAKHGGEYYIFAAVDRVEITAAYSTSLHLYADLSTARFGQIDLFKAKSAPSSLQYRCTRFHEIRLLAPVAWFRRLKRPRDRHRGTEASKSEIPNDPNQQL